MIIIDLPEKPPLAAKTALLCEIASTAESAMDIATPAGFYGSGSNVDFRFYSKRFEHERINPADRPSDAGLISASGLWGANGLMFKEPVTESAKMLAYCEGLRLACHCGYLPKNRYYPVVPDSTIMRFHLDPRGAEEQQERFDRLKTMGMEIFVDEHVDQHMYDSRISFEYSVLPFSRSSSDDKSRQRTSHFKWHGSENGDDYIRDNAEYLVGMFFSGFVADFMEGRSLGWNTYPDHMLSPWKIVDTLCFGEVEEISRLAVTTPLKNEIPRIRHLDMYDLFEDGREFDPWSHLLPVIEGVASIWKASLDDANVKVSIERHVSDETLVAALKNASGFFGIQPKVEAYLLGVPLEDIIVSDSKMHGYH